MPIIGIRSAWAIAFADASPTRMPVNSPGPTSTATTLISSRPMSIWLAHELDRRHERLGVAPPACRLEQPDHALVARRWRR